MGQRHDTLSFLSDYGTDDEFVGVVHSVAVSYTHLTLPTIYSV